MARDKGLEELLDDSLGSVADISSFGPGAFPKNTPTKSNREPIDSLMSTTPPVLTASSGAAPAGPAGPA